MIGYACKWVSAKANAKSAAEEEKLFNGGTTTMSWCDKQPVKVAHDRLMMLAKQNIHGMKLFVEHAIKQPVHARMIRFGSGILPLYTHEKYAQFWQSSEVQQELAPAFAHVGNLCKIHGVRTSWHPDHFVAIASEHEHVRTRSAQDIEYHADMIRLMGLTDHALQSKINIHINGKMGPSMFLQEYQKLSELARQNVTVENSDVGSWEIESCLSLKQVPVVLDLHHHWIQTGQHLEPHDPIWQRVQETWQSSGVQPTIHWSVSKPEHLGDSDELPDLQVLLASGKTKSDLRAHSDAYVNDALNAHVAKWIGQAHIMCECKQKNLARDALLATLDVSKILLP